MMAEDHDGCVGVEFLVGARGDFAHGHEERTGKARGLELPGFADVEKDGWIGLLTLLGVGFGCDLRFKHASIIRDNPGIRIRASPEPSIPSPA
jgi:hypothetical protein